MASPPPMQNQYMPGQLYNMPQLPQARHPTPMGAGGYGQLPPRASQSPAINSNNFPDQLDGIRISKQRARYIASASMTNTPIGPTDPNLQNIKGSDSIQQANHSIMTRKRSRSGSRIAQAQSELPMDKKTAVNDEHSRGLLFAYTQRDALDIQHVMDRDREVDRLARSKRSDTLRYQEDVYRLKSHPQFRQMIMPNGEFRPLAIYAVQKKRPGGRKTEELRYSRRLAQQQAECVEELIPVRLDIELEKMRLRDTFTWNLHDNTIPRKLFVETLVEDFQIPFENRPYVINQVHRELEEQLEDYYPQVYPSGIPAIPELPYWAHKNDDMRMIVKLNITVGHITIIDQFEWDINNPENSPENFAYQMAKDLSLSGEFTTAIAHSIREQTQLYVKALYLSNYEFDGRPIEDPDIRDGLMASPAPSIFRPHQMQKDFSPFLFEMTENDMEKAEVSVMREQRAQKRQLSRRGGPALPDLKERPRTARSLVISSIIPGAAETLEASGIIKVRKVSNRGRRRIVDDESESDDLELDDSGPDSPAQSNVFASGTTTRTRGVRGAATAAQAALRNSYGRSTTPDYMLADSRSAVRRGAPIDSYREDITEPNSLIVRLKITPAKFKLWLAKRKFGRTGAPPLSGFPTSIVMSKGDASKVETSKGDGSSTAKKKDTSSASTTTGIVIKSELQTPKMQNKSLPEAQHSDNQDRTSKDIQYNENGIVLLERTPAEGDKPVSITNQPSI